MCVTGCSWAGEKEPSPSGQSPRRPGADGLLFPWPSSAGPARRSLGTLERRERALRVKRFAFWCGRSALGPLMICASRALTATIRPSTQCHSARRDCVRLPARARGSPGRCAGVAPASDVIPDSHKPPARWMMCARSRGQRTATMLPRSENSTGPMRSGRGRERHGHEGNITVCDASSIDLDQSPRGCRFSHALAHASLAPAMVRKRTEPLSE